VDETQCDVRHYGYAFFRYRRRSDHPFANCEIWLLRVWVEGSIKAVALDRRAAFEFMAKAENHADKEPSLFGVIIGQRLQFGDEVGEGALLGSRLKLVAQGTG
jgi:hypothetical protein